MKIKLLGALVFSLIFSTGCQATPKKPTLKVAATPVPQAELLDFAKKKLAEKGIDLDVVVVDDYNIPNRSLAAKEIDANFFQHIPFLRSQMEQFGYKFKILADVEIEPMGIYSKKIQSLRLIPEKGVVAIPSDPTNEARALSLLQDAGLIKIDDRAKHTATVLNITSNPKGLKILEIDAAMLPRTLQDVDIAVINTNFALQAGFSPRQDALFLENKDSLYVNVIVIREEDAERADLLALKEVMTSPEMRKHIEEKYKGAVLPGF